jgi:hypothetical protein
MQGCVAVRRSWDELERREWFAEPPKGSAMADDTPASSPLAPGGLVIVCPACRATLPERSISLQERRAVCPACEQRFAIDEQLRAPVRLGAARRKRLAAPPGMTARREPDGLSLRWRWPRWLAAGPGLFLIILGAFLAFWVAVRLTIGIPAMDLLLLLLAVPFTFLLWIFLAYRLNSTEIAIGGGRLRVRHSPIPWPGRRDVRSDAIRQVYSQMYHERARRPGDSHTTYRLRAILADGAELLLVHNMTTREQALYLEQEIERFLGLEDERAPGELPRSAT